MKHTILLECGTVGKIDGSCIDFQDPELFIGENASIELTDENGNPVRVEGRIIEILENNYIEESKKESSTQEKYQDHVIAFYC